MTVKSITTPVEERFQDKAPTINFIDTEAYTPDGNEGYTIYAKTESWYNGTCTFVFTNEDNDKRLEETFSIDKKTGCYFNKPFSYFGEDGKWSVIIFLETSNGDFAAQNLNDVEIDSSYKPSQLTFKSVKSTYKKNADGIGVHRFTARLSGKASGECYFLFLPEKGKIVGEFGAVSKNIRVKDNDTCVYEVLSDEFPAKGWWEYSITFLEPYNRFDVKAYEGKEFIYY